MGPGARLGIAVGAALAALIGCEQPEGAQEGDVVGRGTIEDAQARVTRKVIDLEGVTGTALGLCDGKPCIKVYVENDSSSIVSRLPRSESGFPVVVEVTGRFQRW